MKEEDKVKLENDILENIAHLQKYLSRTEIKPANQLIRKQIKIMHNMLVFIHLTKPIKIMEFK